MELDELKSAWAQYDKKLNENLKLNEEILKKMNLDKSKREMSTPLSYEISSAIITLLLTLFLGNATIKYATELKFLIPGIIATLLTFSGFILAIKKVNMMVKIDYYNSPIVTLQKSINIIKQKKILSRKIEYYVFPIYALAFAPIFIKAVYNIDIYSKPTIYYIDMLLSLVFYYPLAIWYSKVGYDAKLKNASNFLGELERFETE